jgi:hypothetical protein
MAKHSRVSPVVPSLASYDLMFLVTCRFGTAGVENHAPFFSLTGH